MKVHIDSVKFTVAEQCPHCPYITDGGEVSVVGLMAAGWPVCPECDGDLNLDECTVEAPDDVLVVEGINVELLEAQRLLLNRALDKVPDGGAKEAVRGIRNMLDDWSDKRYFAKHPEFSVMCPECKLRTLVHSFKGEETCKHCKTLFRYEIERP